MLYINHSMARMTESSRSGKLDITAYILETVSSLNFLSPFHDNCLSKVFTDQSFYHLALIEARTSTEYDKYISTSYVKNISPSYCKN